MIRKSIKTFRLSQSHAFLKIYSCPPQKNYEEARLHAKMLFALMLRLFLAFSLLNARYWFICSFFLIKKSQKIKKEISFCALCLNASNSIKVKTTSAFNELQSI